MPPPDAYNISPAWSLPFVLLLAAIALMPFLHRHWWEKRFPWVAGGLALVPAAYYFLIAPHPGAGESGGPGAGPWLHGMMEYLSFIVLLGSLYVVSGGILIHVSRRATPTANVALLLLGALAANVLGTTGASMLLIRPYLRMNKGRIRGVRPYHIVFFIFIVSNVGGGLTPIGDPPLFLGYLKGVPFWWVLEHCWAPWCVATGSLLAIFFAIDWRDHRRAARADNRQSASANSPGVLGVELTGVRNLLFLGVILLGVFQPGLLEVAQRFGAEGWHAGLLARLVCNREVLMLLAAGGSLLTTPRAYHQRNEFSLGPIREVAVIFLGLFSTMTPALQWLEANAQRMPLKTPGQFYFATGTLSTVLDNAPTYLAFLTARLGEVDRAEVDQVVADLNAMGKTGKLEVDASRSGTRVGRAEEQVLREHPERVRDSAVTRGQIEIAFLLGNPELHAFIVAISLGAVFFGAGTYIGNGPNFMVKAVAQSAGAPTPTFTGYIFRYALPILAPVYLLVWALFFLRG